MVYVEPIFEVTLHFFFWSPYKFFPTYENFMSLELKVVMGSALMSSPPTFCA